MDTYLYILLMITFSITTSEKPAPALFSVTDKLTLLNSGDFQHMVFHKKYIWFVNFYNSWCGHCIRFAPTWKTLGDKISRWSDGVQLGAVDCSLSQNIDLCREYNVDGYPTLKFFPPGVREGFIGLLYEGGREVSNMTQAIIDYLKNVSNSLPIIKDLLDPVNSLEHLTSQALLQKHTILLCDYNNSAFVDAILLDYMQADNVVVRKISQHLITSLGIHTLPSMYLITAQGQIRYLLSGTDEKQYKQIINFIAGANSLIKEKNAEVILQLSWQNTSISEVEGDTVDIADLESAVYYALSHEIATCKNISGEKLVALKNFIKVLDLYFPKNSTMKTDIHNLYKWIVDQQVFSGDTWESVFSATFNSYSVKWICCVGSQPRYRGYPCGLWRLFHTLSVQAYLRQDPSFETKFVLIAMQGYITNFFGCKECAKNFKNEISTFEQEVESKEDSVLYLWKVHNSVNKRLHGDLTEDPVNPKISFPKNTSCPSCRFEQAKWNENEVLRYLLAIYAVPMGTSFYIAKPQPGLHDGNKLELYEAKPQTSYSLGLNGFDLSICIIIYSFICFVIIAVYFHFIRRRRKTKISFYP